MLLKNKTAVIYGAGGAIGGTLAKAFAAEGAKVFLAGRTITKLNVLVKSISSEGGVAEATQLDALNEEAVEKHLGEIIKKTGSIDISFNLIGLDDVFGSPLTEMKKDQFTIPILKAMSSHFITSTAAARQMKKKGSGVILALTANAGREAIPNMGGFGVACSAIEGFCRQLAVDVGSHGIRVVCLRSAGSPDSPGVDEAFRRHAENAGVDKKTFIANYAEKALLKRLPLMKDVADAAILMASDKASALTATILNVTCGEMVD